jgi:hypothetical protein
MFGELPTAREADHPSHQTPQTEKVDREDRKVTANAEGCWSVQCQRFMRPGLRQASPRNDPLQTMIFGSDDGNMRIAGAIPDCDGSPLPTELVLVRLALASRAQLKLPGIGIHLDAIRVRNICQPLKIVLICRCRFHFPKCDGPVPRPSCTKPQKNSCTGRDSKCDKVTRYRHPP